MEKNNSIVLLSSAGLMLCVSLFMKWLTLHNPELTGIDEQFKSLMTASDFNLTGFNGSIGILLKLPIWLIVLLGLVGLFFSLLNSFGVTTLPKILPIGLLAVSALYILMGLGFAIFSTQASLGAGIVVAFIGVLLSFYYAHAEIKY